MFEITIGVLGIQGAIEDHENTIKQAANELEIKVNLQRVSLPEEIEKVDGLVLPGGESTAMTLIGSRNGMLETVNQKLQGGLPAFGTCAGAILLSKKVQRSQDDPVKESPFPVLNVGIIRNGYGRQRESFTTELQIKGMNNPFHGVFIRAPVFREIGKDVEVLAKIKNDPVFVQQNNIIATTFHPELSSDTRIHKLFLKKILERSK